ncbi:hypothetical protein NDU88_000802 [Pleurodeles waltl]|uniref:Uncharacterized protein n=1 Tax=Pleurodeles waltl TaxID=8319 RepID=A0AAV7S937_PLEWA|nr:hypothetical protein NDU88_000802 [Pleurodeles waltl]
METEALRGRTGLECWGDRLLATSEAETAGLFEPRCGPRWASTGPSSLDSWSRPQGRPGSGWQPLILETALRSAGAEEAGHLDVPRSGDRRTKLLRVRDWPKWHQTKKW